MGHYLHFGAGPNQLPTPWQNLNAAHDIRKPLRFEDGSASAVFAEHVIEHVPFMAGFAFLQEVRRVLEPGGVLRLAFPDVARLVASVDRPSQGYAPERGFNPEASRYAAALEQRLQGGMIRKVRPAEKARAAVVMLLVGWDHKAAWTDYVGSGVLLAQGFSTVRAVSYGDSAIRELCGIDGHHLDVGSELAELETTILEAVK